MGWKISVNFPKRWSIVKGLKSFLMSLPLIAFNLFSRGWSGFGTYYLPISVTILDENIRLWWNFKSLAILWGFIGIWQNYEPTLAIFYAIGKIFIAINLQIKEGLFRVKQAEYCQYPVRLFQYKKSSLGTKVPISPDDFHRPVCFCSIVPMGLIHKTLWHC